jgi:hypothetical protein
MPKIHQFTKLCYDLPSRFEHEEQAMIVRAITLVCCAILLIGCSESAQNINVLVPTPTPLYFTPLDTLVTNQLPTSGSKIDTIAYLLIDQQGPRLVDSLSIIDGAVHINRPNSQQVWIDPTLITTFTSAFRSYGEMQFVAVFASGTLVGPGNYGDAQLGYQLQNATLKVLTPEETNISTLSTQHMAYEGRLVRVVGSILTHTGSTLFVDQLGEGGIPAEQAKQLKVRGTVRDAKILSQLQRTPSGIYYGKVQVEGVWYQGQLLVLSLIPIN